MQSSVSCHSNIVLIAGLPPDEKGKNSQLSPGRKGIKRVSKAEFESILAKRVRQELGENCDLVKLQETCKELGVDVYPTVKIFRNGDR